MDFKKCHECSNEFHITRRPIVVNCGHTICSGCFNFKLNKNEKCKRCNMIVTKGIINYEYETLVESLCTPFAYNKT